MAEEMAPQLGRCQILQPSLQGEAGGLAVILRRDFASRDELARYLAEQFPGTESQEPRLSPVRGGRSHADAASFSIDPVRYERSGNYLAGAVTRQSPYIRHGVITLREVYTAAVRSAGSAAAIAKFVSELAWRDYYQRIYWSLGDAVWEDREPIKTGHAAPAYSSSLPEGIGRGETGLACIDAFSRELLETGYLHNHARMWMAAYVVHWRHVAWQAGARWFLTHLLDGDPASNNLSWQWVASTFSNKPYFFNRENVERYTDGAYCGGCPKRGRCDFEGSYEDLSAKLFSLEAAR
jgi:deoxyribodipyrimidine photo-lyase